MIDRSSQCAGLVATALLAGVSLVAVGVPGAAAAGSAAELQQQVELLKQQLERVQKRLEELERQQTETQAAVEKAQTPAAVRSGNDKVRVTIAGQVNRAVLFTDDGHRGDVFFVDNDHSSTRLDIRGTAEVSDELTAGARFEVEFQSNPSNVVSQNNERGVGSNSFDERHLDLFLEHKRLGKLSLGQGDTASNSTSEVDLSGTAVVGYSGLQDLAGGILFWDDATGRTAITVGSVFPNLDGLSRDDRIRYDTPSFAGLQLSASAIADERWDAAVRYNRQYGDTKVAAAVAYSTVPNGQDRVNGSASILFGNGFNLTVAAGRDDPDTPGRDEPTFVYGKVGYRAEFFDFGETALAVDGYVGADTGADGDKARAVGAFVVQKVDAAAMELYAGYRHHDLHRDGFDLEPIDALMTGARVKF